eukprot:2376560-Rhodomonas_salina.2
MGVTEAGCGGAQGDGAGVLVPQQHALPGLRLHRLSHHVSDPLTQPGLRARPYRPQRRQREGG